MAAAAATTHLLPPRRRLAGARAKEQPPPPPASGSEATGLRAARGTPGRGARGDEPAALGGGGETAAAATTHLPRPAPRHATPPLPPLPSNPRLLPARPVRRHLARARLFLPARDAADGRYGNEEGRGAGGAGGAFGGRRDVAAEGLVFPSPPASRVRRLPSSLCGGRAGPPPPLPLWRSRGPGVRARRGGVVGDGQGALLRLPLGSCLAQLGLCLGAGAPLGGGRVGRVECSGWSVGLPAARAAGRSLTGPVPCSPGWGGVGGGAELPQCCLPASPWSQGLPRAAARVECTGQL